MQDEDANDLLGQIDDKGNKERMLPSVEELDTINENSADIKQISIAAQSSYSLVYITAIFHNNVSELREKVKKGFYEINGKQYKEKEPKEKEDKNFIKAWNKLGETQNRRRRRPKKKQGEESVKKIELLKRDDTQKKKEINSKTNKESMLNRLFWSTFFMMLLSCIVQIVFLGTLIEYFINTPYEKTSKIGLIAIRFICCLPMIANIWIEISNGEKILINAIYEPWLYRSGWKRLLSGFAGLMQTCTAFLTFICCNFLEARSQNGYESVRLFACLFVICNIDDFMGSYFLLNNKTFTEYARGKVRMISIINKKDKNRHRGFLIIFYIITGIVFIQSMAILICSFKFNIPLTTN